MKISARTLATATGAAAFLGLLAPVASARDTLVPTWCVTTPAPDGENIDSYALDGGTAGTGGTPDPTGDSGQGGDGIPRGPGGGGALASSQLSLVLNPPPLSATSQATLDQIKLRLEVGGILQNTVVYGALASLFTTNPEEVLATQAYDVSSVAEAAAAVPVITLSRINTDIGLIRISSGLSRAEQGYWRAMDLVFP